jgi:hypothetical protein
MANAKRTPIDLEAVTRDLKSRLAHVVGALEDVIQQPDVILADPKSTFLEIVLAKSELDISIDLMRVSWWPRP